MLLPSYPSSFLRGGPRRGRLIRFCRRCVTETIADNAWMSVAAGLPLAMPWRFASCPPGPRRREESRDRATLATSLETRYCPRAPLPSHPEARGQARRSRVCDVVPRRSSRLTRTGICVRIAYLELGRALGWENSCICGTTPLACLPRNTWHQGVRKGY